MSRWRINFGVGPFRYNRPIRTSTPGPKKPKTALGVVITIVVTLGLIYLCCWGGVAYMSRGIQ